MNAPTGGTGAAPALADFVVLNAEIAALVKARIPLESQLAQLGRSLPGKSGELAERIGRRLERGETLVAAMNAECASLPASYRAAIVAGAESGQLGLALESYVDAASRLDVLRHVAGVAIIYPLMLAIIACWLLATLITRVVPGFNWIRPYRFTPIMWLAEWPYTEPLFLFVLPGLLTLAAAIWWWRSGRLGGVSAPQYRWLAWLPGSRGIHRWSQAATFADSLLLLVQRSIPLDQALQLAGASTDDLELRSAALALAEKSRTGAAIHSELHAGAANEPKFPLLIRLALHHAGNRSLLVGGLQQAASIYRERAVRAAEWYAEYLPILLTVVVGGTLTVGFTLFLIWPYTAALYRLAEANWR